MRMSLPTGKVRAALTFSAVLALATPLNAHKADFGTPDVFDETLMRSGSPVTLTDHSGRTDNSGWMEFKTDPCGMLQGIDSRRSLLKQSGFADDFDDPEDDDDPADLGAQMITRWLAAHPEIAVINEGIAKTCDDEGSLDDDEPPGDFEAMHRDHPAEAPGHNSVNMA